MQESQQSQPGNPSNVSDLMDDWVRVCDTCGDVGVESLLVSCNKCTDGALHTYCMRVELFEKPKSWTCEDCAPTAGTRRALERRIISHQTSTTHSPSSLGREPPSEKSGKAKLGAAGSATSVKPSSNGSFVKEKLTFGLGDGSPNLDSPTDIARNKCSLSAGSLLKSNSSKAANLKPKGQLAKAGRLQKQKVERDPALHDDRKGKKENETITGGDTLLSGSRFCNPDAYGSSRQSDHRSRLSICKTHKDSSSTNKKKNVSQQAVHPAKAAAPITGPASDEMSPLSDLAQVEAETVLQDIVVPNTDHSWLGNFLIHNSEGIATNCDGFQAHLSSCASLKVLEVVGRLPEIILLEELPRLRIWPSQFIGSQVTEENIGLYFFAKDVHSYDTYYRGLMNYMINNDFALKGNLDGVELLIFPSNILPESSQLWNHMMFFWGIFKVQKVSNSANTPGSNSLKVLTPVVSQQAEHPSKAAAPMTGPASDEMSPLSDLAQVEAATLLQGLVVPNTDHSWLGKFLIPNSEGIARNCDGFQAHLSSCASPEVLEVVGRLPEIIILEELPRLRIWPSQFIGSQVTEENIGLYFFAKDVDSYDTYRGLMNYMINNDLVLKGNLDGVELLIFPSNILPERSQLWNQMIFLWGVFKVK